MALRWSEKETDALVELRKLLKDDLVGRPAYPDGKNFVYFNAYGLCYFYEINLQI